MVQVLHSKEDASVNFVFPIVLGLHKPCNQWPVQKHHHVHLKDQNND